MAKQAHDPKTAGNFLTQWITKIRDFYQEVMVEMVKVTWPTQDDLRSSTTVVLMLLVLMAVIVGTFDLVFQQVVMRLLRLA